MRSGITLLYFTWWFSVGILRIETGLCAIPCKLAVPTRKIVQGRNYFRYLYQVNIGELTTISAIL